MTVRRTLIAVVVLFLAAATPAFAGSNHRAQHAKTWTWSFSADTLAHLPANTAAFGGAWSVVIDSSRAIGLGAAAQGDSAAAESVALAPRVLRQSDSDDGIRFHFIQFKKPVLENIAASVRFRILSGDIDPTAGLMFQLDAKGRNGYVVRVSGESNQLIAHYLLYGRRRDIRFVKIAPPEPGKWHTLSVDRKGSVMVVSYDGEEKMRLRDERFSSGSVGLWTEDDTVVDFDQLTVTSK